MQRLIFNLFVLLIVLVGFLNFGFTNSSLVWKKARNGVYEPDTRCLIAHPKSSSLYLGTSKALYKSNDGANAFKRILQIQSEYKGINDVYIDKDNESIVYAATDAGLYKSIDSGRNWIKFFSSSDDLSIKCNSLIVTDGFIYLGTNKGIFKKKLDEESWQKLKGEFSNKAVYDLVEKNNIVYFSTSKTLYALDEVSEKVSQIYSLGLEDSMEEYFSSSEAFIKSLKLVDKYIFIASIRGIYFSADLGNSWDTISTSAIPINKLNFFTAKEISSHDKCIGAESKCFSLLVGTEVGAFFFENEKWFPVYLGMETRNVNCLAIDGKGEVYAATDRGVFCLHNEKALPQFANVTDIEFNVTDFLSDEPSIGEVHNLSINYAEVSPNKIKQWRSQASKRAWFPDLSIGIDGKRNKTTGESVWGSYSGGGQHYIGPDDHTYYRNFGWDVSLSWDMGDLVWNSDQTSIDSRSKMMVELRGDILDQVTRLYFERRRIKVEMSMANLDSSIRLEKELRVEELTALIDGMTGGEFSELIKERR
ncbi:MAG: hypothetical protein P9X22_08510 [Candidatus Zapsychrus exili]|nr:hypothetical protein [Candidatus Zapsychrus exili]